MGEPYFKLQPLIKSHNLKVVSSNFALYGDISRRMMIILEDFSPACEIYSIDECFLDFSGLTVKQIQSQSQLIGPGVTNSTIALEKYILITAKIKSYFSAILMNKVCWIAQLAHSY